LGEELIMLIRRKLLVVAAAAAAVCAGVFAGASSARGGFVDFCALDKADATIKAGDTVTSFGGSWT
jgi:hypothetical protein